MPTLAQKVMLEPGLGGPVGSLVYLLRDEFTTAQSAPLTSPRACEPGPGTLTKQTDSLAIYSIASNEFTPGAAATGALDPLYTYDSVSRVAGRTLKFRFRRYSAFGSDPRGTRIGFISNLGNVSIMQGMTPGQAAANNRICFLQDVGTGFLPTSITLADDTWATCEVVLQSTGYLLFVNELLEAVILDSTSTPLYPCVVGVATGRKSSGVDYMRMADLPGGFAVQRGLCTVDAPAPASGTGYTATADGIHIAEFTLPASPSSNQRAVELRYRSQDSSNEWRIVIARDAGNTIWNITQEKVTGGTPASTSLASGITADSIMVRAIGNAHDIFSRVSGGGWAQRGSTVTDAYLNTQAAINATYNAGTTLARLSSYPNNSSLYAPLATI